MEERHKKSPPPGPEPDAPLQPGADVPPQPGADAPPPAGPDTAPQSGPDAPPPAGPDTAAQPGPDAPPPAGRDTAPQSGPDAPPRAGPDTPPQPGSEAPPSPGSPAATFRCGYVAIAGAPNVGKSTLMNRLLEAKLAIVTAKPQTTRRKTLGIAQGQDYQMVLLDTPGLMQPRYDLHRAMLRESETALGEADVVLFLADPRGAVEVPEAVRSSRVPRVLALNKCDRAKRKADLLPVLSAWDATGLFSDLVPISALTGEGVAEMVQVLVGRLPAGPPLYPPDQLAQQPERFFVAEIVRERLFELYEQEVPYAAEVVVEEFKERPGAKDYIEAWIFVEQESQKRILIGHGGAAIRALGEDARAHLEEFLGRPVYLSLRVRILPQWRKRPSSLRKLGYSAPSRPKPPRTAPARRPPEAPAP